MTFITDNEPGRVGYRQYKTQIESLITKVSGFEEDNNSEFLARESSDIEGWLFRVVKDRKDGRCVAAATHLGRNVAVNLPKKHAQKLALMSGLEKA